MKFLTWGLYKKNANDNMGEHWKDYKSRWRYHKIGIEIIKRSNITDPKKVLEMGTMGAPLVIGSDTMDIDSNESWIYKSQKPTYLHDARELPWPIKDKQYQLFIALRVYHHLSPLQKECFKEALRIADNVLLVVPHKKVKKTGIDIRQFLDWNNGKPPTIIECTPLNSANHYLYYWGDNLLKTTFRERIETWFHLHMPYRVRKFFLYIWFKNLNTINKLRKIKQKQKKQ